MKSAIDFEDIKRQAQDLQTYHGKSKELFKQYDDIFFMEDKEQRPQVPLRDLPPRGWL